MVLLAARLLVHPVALMGIDVHAGEEAGEHHVHDTPSESELCAEGASDGPPVFRVAGVMFMFCVVVLLHVINLVALAQVLIWSPSDRAI